MKGITTFLLLAMMVPLGVFAAQESAGYKFDFGFESKPAFIEERNQIVLSVVDELDVPIEGLKDSLELELEAGKTIKTFDLEPGVRPGMYTVGIVPTGDGEWVARVSGDIDGTAVSARFSCAEGDFMCPEHRTELGFPGDAIESQKLWTRLGELEVGVANATASDPMAFFGIIAGVLGLLAGGAALMRRRDI